MASLPERFGYVPQPGRHHIDAVSAPFRITRTMRSPKIAALDFIKRYYARWGHSPTLGEISGHLDVTRQRARVLVQELSDERQIHVVSGKTRGIRLIDRRDEISIADAVLMLRREGITVLHDAEGAERTGAVLSGEPLSYPPLSLPPDLDYLPDVDSEAGKHDGDSSGR